MLEPPPSKFIDDSEAIDLTLNVIVYPVGRWLILTHYAQEQILIELIDLRVVLQAHLQLYFRAIPVLFVLPWRVNAILEYRDAGYQYFLTVGVWVETSEPTNKCFVLHSELIFLHVGEKTTGPGVHGPLEDEGSFLHGTELAHLLQ